MQKIVFFITFLICGVTMYSQQPNYLYIEAEKGQPFYVKIKDKVQSCSPGGYIIIPNLLEDSYTLNIGFPKNAFPEQRFTIALNKTDKGYQLKNLGEKGWGLFDLQTMALLANNNMQSDTNEVKKTDAFSTLLSKVVNDPAVLIENKKPAIVSPQSPLRETSAETKAIAKKVNPVKLLEWQTDSTYESIYTGDANDTIRISYPIDKSVVAAPPATQLTDKKEPAIQSTPQHVPATDTQKPDSSAAKITNSDCKSFANEQDVDKLRVKILAQGDMDDKLSAAKKYFRGKCFTVKQIRALAELFTQDENKYQLFDIAYPFTSDTENFYQLENGLETEYFKNRFKAMIKK
jgi:hypothetical protein